MYALLVTLPNVATELVHRFACNVVKMTEKVLLGDLVTENHRVPFRSKNSLFQINPHVSTARTEGPYRCTGPIITPNDKVEREFNTRPSRANRGRQRLSHAHFHNNHDTTI